MTPAQDGIRARLRAAVRDVPDYPKPGILFKDITPLIGDAELFRAACTAMTAPFTGDRITHVVAVESRGFLFGGPIAHALNAGLVPVRKVGKLPYRSERVEYALEYGTDSLEMHVDALRAGARALVVDDLLATGGTAAATCRLTEKLGATVIGCSFLISLAFLDGAKRLDGRQVAAVIEY